MSKKTYGCIIAYLEKNRLSLASIKALHAVIILHGFSNPHSATRLVRSYSLKGDLSSARKVFDKTPHRTTFLWNSIIRAYAQSQRFTSAFLMFKRMINASEPPDNFTLACLIRASHENSDALTLKVLHKAAVVLGLGFDPVCCSALVTAYSKLDRISEAVTLFERIAEPDTVLWNSIINGCAYNGRFGDGFRLFNQMRREGAHADGHSFSAIIPSTMDDNGPAMHCLALKSGADEAHHVASSLITMYARLQQMDHACRLFNHVKHRDEVTWSALITGYSNTGDTEKTIALYKEVTSKGAKRDPILLVSVIAAAASATSIASGSAIHGVVLKEGFEEDIIIQCSLIDMYSKSGFLERATRVFSEARAKNVVVYNAMIVGYGLSGKAKEAVGLVREMEVAPDGATFAGVLSACCHVGWVREGVEVYRRMEEWGVKAGTEHQVYVVKLHGMAMEWEEAWGFVGSLGETVDAAVWRALLSCCVLHGNAGLAQVVERKLMGVGETHGLMMGSVYAHSGRWDCAQKVRSRHYEKETKLAGSSWALGM